MNVDLLRQPVYKVTPTTGVVHSVPCIRMPDSAVDDWPEFYDDRDRACSKCLPDGLPDCKPPAKKQEAWVAAFVEYVTRPGPGNVSGRVS